MNEEEQITQEPEQKAPDQSEKLPKAKRSALVRYMAILFAFAFVLVLLSLVMQYYRSSETISELNASQANALARAEQLQEENRSLEITIEQMEQDGEKALQEHEDELAGMQESYDALLRILMDPENIADPDFAEDVKTVKDGREKLTETAWAAFAALAEDNGMTLTED